MCENWCVLYTASEMQHAIKKVKKMLSCFILGRNLRAPFWRRYLKVQGVRQSGWFLLIAIVLSGCASEPELPPATIDTISQAPLYKIGPGDVLSIFVWDHAELESTVTVRPDGHISAPLIRDLSAAGKTPSELASDINQQLNQYIVQPLTAVMVTEFAGTNAQQVRVVGEATDVQAIPYRADMTLLDVMIVVGGLTEFASGNRATIVRIEGDTQKVYAARLDDLLRDGDITANVAMLPGDVVIIPKTIF